MARRRFALTGSPSSDLPTRCVHRLRLASTAARFRAPTTLLWANLGSVPRSRPTPEPDLRLRGPADIVHAIPYLLGFHPHESLVLIGLDGCELVVTARVDLADLSEPTVAAETMTAMRRGGTVEVVAVLVTESPSGADPQRWRSEVRMLSGVAAAGGCELLDVLLVAAGRWRSLICADPLCCPPDGHEIPALERSAVAATATFAGLVALPDRDSLAALLAPRSDTERAGLVSAVTAELAAREQRALVDRPERGRRSDTRALFAAARRMDAGPTPPTEGETVRFGAALTDIAVRDSLWVAVDDRRLDGRELWRALAVRLPPPYDAAPLFLFSWSSWRAGNGALAGIAAERAVTSDPGYSAADLLLAAVRHGIDPRRLPRLRLRRSA